MQRHVAKAPPKHKVALLRRAPKASHITTSRHKVVSRAFSTETKPPTAQEIRKQQKAARAAARGAPAAPTEAEQLGSANAPTDYPTTAVSHTLYSNNRAKDFATVQAKHPHWTGPYHDHIEPTTNVKSFVETYHDLPPASRLENVNEVRLNGRITSKRTSSSKLVFIDIADQSQDFQAHRVQVLCSASQFKDDQHLDVAKVLKTGDWISVQGFPGKSDKGELSLIAQEVTLLSPCLHFPPEQLTDPNIRFRNRHLDLLVNSQQTMNIFRTRSQVLFALRQYLNEKQFVEVETPILWTQSGGATARPFETTSNAFGADLPLYLRIAPELFLKQLVIGGMPKVFEIGKVFRNEGVDPTHNPEFTSCELYNAHADYKVMMDFTEDLLRFIVKQVNPDKSLRVPVLPQGVSSIETPERFKQLMASHLSTIQLPETQQSAPQHDDTTQDNKLATVIDFSQPFQRFDVVETLSKHGIELPPNFNEDEALPILRDICAQRGWTLKAPFTVARCLDTMIAEVIEPLCIQPSFIMNHPIALSPLAKRSSTDPRLTERFELFINTKEYINAYSELNIPSEQLERFVGQHNIKQLNQGKEYVDDEAHPVDTPFCEALQYGLPPTGGWGLGIDRLVMLLSQSQNIREVIYFPVMKPEINN